MKTTYPEYWPQFYTATIYKWQHLLAEDKHKDIIVESFRFLVTEKRIELNAFDIMSNHIRLVWQPMFGFTPSAIQSSFMKFTPIIDCSCLKLWPVFRVHSFHYTNLCK